MLHRIDRRHFLKHSALASSATAMTYHCEEKALLAQLAQAVSPSPSQGTNQNFPNGKLGKLSVSRMICGGNLISGFAHSRDLIYVSPLLKHYFTEEKVLETLALCEAHGINTAILRLDNDTLRILKKYWSERGGNIQWIAQIKIQEHDMSDINIAVDNGAVAAFVHGGVGDSFVAQGKVDLLGKAVDLIKQNGVVSGIAGHAIAVHKAVEQARIKPDFFMKTFNSKHYWSAGPQPRNDSVWEETPEETKAFMAEVERPWIAYKVLGAGAIHPQEGFQYAFQHGADFICVGMFDFQVAEDVKLARMALARAKNRERDWFA